jgi:hypothetical protein
MRSLIFAIALLLPFQAEAGEFKAGNWVADCLSAETSRNCIDFAAGAANAFALSSVICPPQDITVGDLQRIALDWIQRNPESKHYNAAKVMMGVWLERFPCPDSSRSQ